MTEAQSTGGATTGTGAGRLYFLHALTPVHVGTGDAVGAVNLPTAKDAITKIPLVPGSSVKGVLRTEYSSHYGLSADQEDKFDVDETLNPVWHVFGPSNKYAASGRGAVAFGDARLLALPVRTLQGLFMWVTSPHLVRRLQRDCELAEVADTNGSTGATALCKALLEAFTETTETTIVAEPPAKKEEVARRQSELWVDSERIFVEERLEKAVASPELYAWGKWVAETLFGAGQHTMLTSRLVMVGDGMFGALCQRGLELRSRVRIDPKTGTAASSGPWIEEHLPTETLLSGVMLGRDAQIENPEQSNNFGKASANDALSSLYEFAGLNGRVLRFGGKASIGLGRMRLVIAR